MSFMSLSCLTRRDAKSSSVISATVRARREELANALPLRHCARGRGNTRPGAGHERRDGHAMGLRCRGSRSVIFARVPCKLTRIKFGREAWTVCRPDVLCFGSSVPLTINTELQKGLERFTKHPDGLLHALWLQKGEVCSNLSQPCLAGSAETAR